MNFEATLGGKGRLLCPAAAQLICFTSIENTKSFTKRVKEKEKILFFFMVTDL